MSLGFTTAIGAHFISEEVVGFSPLWFPRGKSLCLLSLVIDWVLSFMLLLRKIFVSIVSCD